MSNQLVTNLLVAMLKILVILVSYVICAATVSAPKPMIQTKPQEVTVATEGDTTVKLYCTVKNLGTYNVSWLRNGKKITRNKEVLFEPFHYEVINVDQNAYHLHIKRIQRNDDKWKYQCAIFNNDELETTHDIPATIAVQQIPQTKYPTCDQIENGYNENTTITVICRGEIINPRVRLEWRKNGTAVEAKNSQVKGEEVLSYSFRAQQSDSGSSLKCVMYVIPTGEMLYCSPGQLNIMYKPNITIHKPDTVAAGKEAVYICLAMANPQITSYTWHVPPNLRDKNYKSDQGVLRITPSLRDNMTQIACTASNQIGNVTKRITLRLQKSDTSHNRKVSKSSPTFIENDNSNISLFAIVLVAVGCSSLILLLMVIPVCYYYTCQRHEEGLYMPRRLPIMVQPDVYSEPKDMAFSDPNQNRTLPLLPSGTVHGKWKRSVGVQVPLEIEIEDVYAHVEGEAGSLNLSRVRSTKSEYV